MPIEEPTMAKVEQGHIVETALEARGAEPGPSVRWVLFISIFAVAAIFAGLLAYYFGN
jgi:hypothetical protein